MRKPKENETVKKRRGGTFEYYDDLGRNTFYANPHKSVWYSKEWVRLPNGEDRETYVESNNGYWRRHTYDIHTGILIKEWDSKGEINLISKRQQWNPKDTQLSLEYKNRGKSMPGASVELF